jgi:thiol-disulfide isomerase/thioredoxin
MKKLFLLFFFSLIFHSTIQAQLKTGTWRGILNLNGEELPFNFNVFSERSSTFCEIINGDEKILMEPLGFKDDSVFIKFPVYDSEIRAKILGDRMEGNWYNNNRNSKNIIPFSALFGDTDRFKIVTTNNDRSFAGKHAFEFISTDASGVKKKSKAIAVFSQNNNIIKGSVLTTTGDYRFLHGVVDGQEVKFSSFTGTYAYLFKGKFSQDSIKGVFYSGIHFSEEWIAYKNDEYALPDPEQIVKVNPGVEVKFSFADLQGKIWSYPEDFKGKVLLLQIMGSWCGNCMDETRLLAQWNEILQPKGMEIVALAFERHADTEKAKASVLKFKDHTKADYLFLLAGKSDKAEASKALPFLTEVHAYPTTVVIDKNGSVRKIHTGFSGPATGEAFLHFKATYFSFLEELLKE